MKKAHALYLKACKALGKTPVPVLEDRSDLDKVSSDAFERLVTCIRYLNMNKGVVWIPKYDGTEWHYWPYFKYTSGFGFSGTVYDYWRTHTFVGSRLEYRTRELAKKGAELLQPYYNDYFTQ